ncbi:MAG: aldo/keto reductase [Clostridiales bacterium]|nr:aldo/keto reductase [Clostridiales bacterium]
MKYRKFVSADKKTELDISLLGFGCMRLPVIGDDMAKIDEAEAIRMIRYAIDHGVNYVDTAYMYHGETSEGVVGKALADGYRERVNLATKLAYWFCEKPEDMEKMLDEQLRRLGTDVIDFYLLHDIEGERWIQVKKWKMFDFLTEMKAKGKIRFAGFSCHGSTPAYFKEVLDAYPWDFTQIQLNYIDQEWQAGMEGYRYAAEKGVPLIIMEPLKGGKLTDSLPEAIQKTWAKLGASGKERTPAEWALRWAANLPGVMTILSGMSKMEQVQENVRVLADAEAGALTDRELAILDEVAAAYNKLIVYPCTACRYCLPCTSDIAIPMMMNYRNDWELYGHNPKLQAEFDMFVEKKPSACTECGKCERNCPQQLPIMQVMKEVSEIFE